MSFLSWVKNKRSRSSEWTCTSMIFLKGALHDQKSLVLLTVSIGDNRVIFHKHQVDLKGCKIWGA